MTATTAAGSSIAISAALPATEDTAGYAALTFTDIGGVEKLGAFGATTAKVDFQPLKGPKEKLKGSTDYGSLTVSLAHDKADAGQTLLRTAGEPDNNALYAYKITFANGDRRFSQGRVFGYPETVDGADSIIMANPVIEFSKKIVKADAV